MSLSSIVHIIDRLLDHEPDVILGWILQWRQSLAVLEKSIAMQ
jgi:hypothetical protein